MQLLIAFDGLHPSPSRPRDRVLAHASSGFKECHAGAAGIEFALVAGTLCLIMLNAFDVANYIYKRMQVENAAQMGAQAAWKTCDPTMLPATKLCAGLNTAVTAAVQSTSLGQGVTLEPGSLSEGYFCLDLSGSSTCRNSQRSPG